MSNVYGNSGAYIIMFKSCRDLLWWRIFLSKNAFSIQFWCEPMVVTGDVFCACASGTRVFSGKRERERGWIDGWGRLEENRPRPGQAAIVLFAASCGSPPALFSLIFSSDSLFSSQGFQCCRGVRLHMHTQQEGCNAGRSCKNCCWLSFFVKGHRLKNKILKYRRASPHIPDALKVQRVAQNARSCEACK